MLDHLAYSSAKHREWSILNFYIPAPSIMTIKETAVAAGIELLYSHKYTQYTLMTHYQAI